MSGYAMAGLSAVPASDADGTVGRRDGFAKLFRTTHPAVAAGPWTGDHRLGRIARRGTLLRGDPYGMAGSGSCLRSHPTGLSRHPLSQTVLAEVGWACERKCYRPGRIHDVSAKRSGFGAGLRLVIRSVLTSWLRFSATIRTRQGVMTVSWSRNPQTPRTGMPGVFIR